MWFGNSKEWSHKYLKPAVPAHSVIYAGEWPSYSELAGYLKRTAGNLTAYSELHAWRYQPKWRAAHSRLTALSRVALEYVPCMICRDVHRLAVNRTTRARAL